MLIRELQVINFRNLRFLRAELGEGIHLVHGPNAQGKTNLLEAVHLLVTGRSFRTNLDREMVPWNRDGYEATLIRARVEKSGDEERFLLTFNQSEKHIFVNGTPIGRLGELVGRINAVLFTPSDLQLVQGAPGLRRRFLDIELSQVSRPYLHHLQRYDLALRQRNALLKQHQRRPSLPGELAAWDVQLAEHGSEITAARGAALARLSALAAETYADIAGGAERLALRYAPSVDRAGTDAASIRGQMLDALASAQPDDIRRGSTSVGPHRDDFTFLIEGHDARDFGSQGQQRSCILAMKLAELNLMEEATGETPILMLDDLMSELDESRKRAFLSSLDPRIQTIITATERELVTGACSPARSYRVEDGEFTAE